MRAGDAATRMSYRAVVVSAPPPSLLKAQPWLRARCQDQLLSPCHLSPWHPRVIMPASGTLHATALRRYNVTAYPF